MATPLCAATQSSTPLLIYAASQRGFLSTEQGAQRHRLDQITHTIEKNPPPEQDCARTLGARRFANLYDDLGATYSALGNPAEAAGAFAKAVACNPRASYLHAELASEFLHLGRFEDAEAEARRGLHPEGPAFMVHSLLAQAEFSEQQWTQAIPHLRLAALEAPDDVQATYWQCLLWLAQKRAGIAAPALASRPPTKLWPRPILDFLQNRIDESALRQAVAAEREDRRRREILCEALFYTGENYLAAHRIAEARRYFQATLDLQVYDFIEHYLAKAELTR